MLFSLSILITTVLYRVPRAFSVLCMCVSTASTSLRVLYDSFPTFPYLRQQSKPNAEPKLGELSPYIAILYSPLIVIEETVIFWPIRAGFIVIYRVPLAVAFGCVRSYRVKNTYYRCIEPSAPPGWGYLSYPVPVGSWEYWMVEIVSCRYGRFSAQTVCLVYETVGLPPVSWRGLRSRVQFH